MLYTRHGSRIVSRALFNLPRWRNTAHLFKPRTISGKAAPPPEGLKRNSKSPPFEAPPSSPRQWTLKRVSRELWEWVKIITGIAVVGHVVITHGFSIAPSMGPSMLPTLEVSDWLLTSKIHRRGRDVKVGDVVSFLHPVEGHKVVKRIHGMPGDFVLRDTPGAGEGVMLQVPEGHFWAIGDNMAWSIDSRLYGPVPLALIRGKIVAKLRPFRFIENNLEAAVAEVV